MDNTVNQPSSFRPLTGPPCSGHQGQMMPGQQMIPGQQMNRQPTIPPRQDLLRQTPTGIPQGPDFGLGPSMQQDMMQQPMMTPMQAPQDTTPIVPWNQPIPVTTESLQYMNGFMRTQIGRRVKVEFLIGTNTLTDRTGTLLAVGANYILINEVETDDILLCDFYSIKFMKFYY